MRPRAARCQPSETPAMQITLPLRATVRRGGKAADCTGGESLMRMAGTEFPEPLMNALRDGGS